MFKKILLYFSLSFVIFFNIQVSEAQRATYLPNNVNLFLDDPSDSLVMVSDYIYPIGVVIIDSAYDVTDEILLDLIDFPVTSSFVLERTQESRKIQGAYYKKFQQYHSGIKVMGGGYNILIDLNNPQDPKILKFSPNIFYNIDINLNPIIDSLDIISILDSNEIFHCELLLSNNFGSGYQLIWEVEHYDSIGHHTIISAENGEILQSEHLNCQICCNGTTPTYGVKEFSNYEENGKKFLESPDRRIKIYESNPYRGYHLNPGSWNQNDVPTTLDLETWDNDALPHSIQSYYAVEKVLGVFENELGIEFGDIHVAVRENQSQFRGSVSQPREDPLSIVSMWYHSKEGVPVSVYDVVGHEFGHPYSKQFISRIDAKTSGPLVEAFADIFGTYVESLIQEGGVDWVIGDDEPDLAAWINRDLSIQVCLDYFIEHDIRMHQRGLVLGHWYYALSTGIPEVNIVELGMLTTLELIIASLQGITTTYPTFEEFRDLTLITALNEFSFHECSPEYKSIVNAWDRVCVTGYSSPCKCDSYTPPQLTESVVFNTCPELFVNLNNYYTSTPPEDAILVWSTSSDPESEPFPIIDPFIIHEQTTTFYAYYYNAEADCYSEPSAGIEVTIRSCCSETENVYISGNVNYENPMSIGGNILIEDQGTLTITSYLELGGDKGIYVENGGKLIIEGQDAILTVCNPPTNLWNGISVKPGSELETRGGKILNAKNGIDAQMGLFSPTQPLIDIQGIEIIGNSLPNSRGISLYGVTALNLSEIIVEGYTYGVWMWGGSDLHLISQSEFKNIGYTGIYSVFNNFIVNHCIFQDSDVGVLAQHNNFGIINESSFSDLTTGIRTWHSNKMTIQNNQLYLKSVPDSRGIFLFDSPQSIISNNSAIEAEHYGILAINSPGVWIENNFISKEDDTSPTPTGGAISLVNSSSSTVMDNNINAERSIYGIEANNSHKVLITGNNIQNQLGQTVINLIGSMGVITYSNSLIGSQLCFYGINLSNSAGNEIRCNNIENCNYGLHVSHNSEYQNILGNVLDNTEDLTIRSEIGLQPFHGNLFIGGVTRAIGLRPQAISNSRFLVNSEHDYHMPTNPNPGNGQWFIDIGTPDFYECPDGTNIPDPELWTPFSNDSLDLCQYYLHLKTLDTLKPNKFFLGAYDLWFVSESRQNFSLPGCILSDPDFQNLCGMQEMATVVMDLEQLGQHELATDSLKSYQLQWIEATDSVVQLELKNLIAAELDSLSPDIQDARVQDSLLLSSINSDLNAISCSSTLVSTWKGIYKKYLSFLHAGEVDSSDYSTLRQYSTLCSDIYGKPIHLARAVTATFDTINYAQYDNCLPGMEQRIILEQTIEEPIEIWPNPTSGSVQISLPENYSGILTVTDISGRKIHSQTIKESNLSYLELPYQNGVYIFNFYSDKGTASQHKVLLLR